MTREIRVTFQCVSQNCVGSKYFEKIECRNIFEFRYCLVGFTGALSIKPLRKRAWLQLQQLTGAYQDITWHASTEQEKEEIQRWFPRADIRVALNLPVPFDPLPAPVSDGAVRLLSVQNGSKISSKTVYFSLFF